MILKKKIYADSLDSVSLELIDAKVDMKEMKKEIDDMITVDDEAKVAYDEWALKNPHWTKVILIRMENKFVTPHANTTEIHSVLMVGIFIFFKRQTFL